MSKFITLQDLHNKIDCPINLFVFQNAGLDKVDFDKIYILQISYQYWEDFLWLINNFSLTICVYRDEDEKLYYKNGNRVRTEKSNGFWENFEFDNAGNEIESLNSCGLWTKCQYNKKGKIIRFESENGWVINWGYDQSGNCVKHEDSSGLSEEWKYDGSGNQIRYELFDNNGYWREMEYNQSGDMIFQKTSKGVWENWQYDKNRILIRHEKSSGLLEKWKMNQDGEFIRFCIREDKWQEDILIEDLKKIYCFLCYFMLKRKIQTN